MKYKALALDLDGTLTNSKKEVTKETKEAIDLARKKGIKIILASGRPLLGIQGVARELGLHTKGGYIIGYNGGQILECKENKVLAQRVLPVESYARICEIGRSCDVATLTYDAEGILSEWPEHEYVIKEAFNNQIPIKKVQNLAEELDKELPVIKFMMVGEHDKLLIAQKMVKESFGEEIDAFFSESYFLEVVPSGVEKAAALETLLQTISVSREELVACGDGLNDLPMLRYAGLAIAMGNAYEEVKKEADYITLSNDENGVVYAIKEKLLDR